ncbi:MAG: hypothetical protein ACOX25_04005 [Caldicoprobacterales bacterium]|jgi:hypothetical protein|nr:hypothetical protein [Clostridiales bacterium]
MVDMKEIDHYQKLLNKIPGIINTRIIVDDNGNLTEVHVLSDLSRGPKQIVRDIQSALIASYNLSVDHKIISVAQVGGSNIGMRDFRLNIDSVQIFSRQGMVEARVLLKKDHRVYEGVSSGGNSAQGRLRVVAEAALRAVHQFTNKDFQFVLSDVVRISLADRNAIAVSILHFTGQGEEYLSGSAFVHNDESVTVVKATLNAINRRLPTCCEDSTDL